MSRSILKGALLGASIMLLAAGANAQPVWNIEIVGGLNLSQLRGDDTDARIIFSDEDIGTGEISGDIGGNKFGFTAGALVTVQVNENFGVQSGFLWGRKGSDGEIAMRGDIPGLGVVDLTADVTLTLDYLDIPILGVLTFPAGETTSIRAMVGPVLGFNTNAEVEVSLAGTSRTEDISDGIKSVDVAGLLGAGVVFHLNSVNVILDGRYAFGFSSIDDETDFDVKNAGFTLLAGLGIPLTP
jgi:hypothetical protein